MSARLRAVFRLVALGLANVSIAVQAEDTNDVLQSFDNFKIEKKKELPPEAPKEIPKEVSKEAPKKTKKVRKKIEEHVSEKPAEATAIIPSAEPIAPPAPEPEYGLLGSWLGGKSYLSAHGVDISLVIKNESSHNFSGGAEQGTAT